ncbi:GGDEF domain-containing protein [Aestuariibacter sp. GS-14]|uniref:GGDEF domain-containing protein n=1 Tax=Aestuariibacter sp. GS-14 TaxID=2590670 RepID=UPI001129D760|nr:GGDEF domain-containing protein [Aestuariibacter sp. GS-14]TPV61010.1 GGDEF domain-containing protein [Aestuariibacter sp. GS-14]
MFTSPLSHAQEAIELLEQADSLRVMDRQASLALLKKVSRYTLSSSEQDYLDYLHAFHVAMNSDISKAAKLLEPITIRHDSGRLALRSRATLLSLYAGLKEWEKGVLLVDELVEIQSRSPRDSDWFTARIGQVFFFLHLELFNDALQLIMDARSYPEPMSDVLNCRFTTYEFTAKKGVNPSDIDDSWLDTLQKQCDALQPSVYTIDYLVTWSDLLNSRQDYGETVAFVESHQSKVKKLDYFHLWAALQNHYALALFSLQRYDQAELIVDDLLANPVLTDYLQGYIKASLLKSELAIQQHQYAQAYHWLRIVNDLRHQEQKSAMAKKLAVAQAEFSLAASERAMQSLAKQNALLERELLVSHQRMLNTYLVAVLSVSLIMLLLVTLYRHKQQRKTLVKMANTDALTGLHNRRCFTERVTAYLANPDHAETCSMILLDLDNLKWVNDGFGHQSGDWVLQNVSNVILELRTPQVLSVARIGGEEIAIFLVSTNASQAEQFAWLISQQLSMISTKKQLDGRVISASYGVCDSNSAGRSLTSMLNAADVAMYQAKRAGKKQVVVYQPAPEFII